ncbi:DUF58 domain-containing protein [Halopelagius longus]|uniref:DUF58 domain-containing protein n=1 Tax=Halopelagius longus TaxID=1236180 RepID=A0A1H0XY32_9EURY|nr:DUF58 domain-containing protein [Halopelagius longus]RDI72164.1 DUF58 domain-containing protein [Halopelagius longus]SDQ07745.1 Uncharacterized conserved protein, DUF58 family, contains vWF domain [Halopelagius longus]
MRLTRRGVALLVVVASGVVLAAVFGPRALNALVLPAVVALAAAVVQVYRADPPRVERRTPAADFPDTAGTVTLSLESERSYPATVTDDLPAALDGDATLDVVVGGAPASYEVTYRKRGEHEIGPLSLVSRDVLGLAKRELVAEGTDSVLVYPPVRQLTRSATQDLSSLNDPEPSNRRDEFDHLREYARGDSLRDVHWKSSAKRNDLIVKEYVPESDAESVLLSAGGVRSAGDRMAEAAATLSVSLVRNGVPVTLSTPSGVVEAPAGDERSLLEHLARAESGRVPDESADVVVRADESNTTVRVGDEETTFESLVGDGAGEATGLGTGDAGRTAASEEVTA